MLRARLKNAQIKNSESNYFLPDNGLYEILTGDVIKNCISEAEIDVSWKQPCIQAVLDGGRSLLALLILIDRVHILVTFLEMAPSLASTTLDSRFPFSEEDLERIIRNEDEDARIDFYRRQWEVAAPIFCVGQPHYSYYKETIFPFVESKPMGAGAFGDVFTVRLPGGHHGFDFNQGRDVNSSRSRCSLVTHLSTDSRGSQNFEGR